jgi:hypothetical protein
MRESPFARGTDIAALADVPAPSTRATTAGIFKLDIFMAFTSHNGADPYDESHWRTPIKGRAPPNGSLPPSLEPPQMLAELFGIAEEQISIRPLTVGEHRL